MKAGAVVAPANAHTSSVNMHDGLQTRSPNSVLGAASYPLYRGLPKKSPSEAILSLHRSSILIVTSNVVGTTGGT